MIYDVIVCGGGPSGINAAISAKRNGANVLLIESTGLLGGNLVLSLVAPWMTFHKNNSQIVKGIAGEIVDRLVDSGKSYGYITDPIGFCDTITPVDIEGVKQLFFEMIVEEDIDVLLHAFIFDVIKEDNHIKGVKTISKSGVLNHYAKVVIDTTGDGDVSKYSGCDFVIGRDKDNLSQPMTMIFHVGNVDIKQLREAIKENPKDFVVRDNYDYKYLGISGFFSKIIEAKENNDFDLPRDRVLLFEEIKEGYVSVNMTRVQKRSGVDLFELSDAEIIGRKQISSAFNFLKKYIPGFKNSFISMTPSSIGIRETRHIIGEYIIKLSDITTNKNFDDSIALSGFPIDIHSPETNELKYDNIKIMNPIQIPQRCLIPKHIEGLIVAGRCISATHEASASIRVVPTAMAIGEAAGIISAIAIAKNILPRSVDYQDVQKQLKKQNQLF